MRTSDPDLFDVRRRKKAPRPPAPNGAVQHLISTYVASYTARFDEPPVITKKDGALHGQSSQSPHFFRLQSQGRV